MSKSEYEMLMIEAHSFTHNSELSNSNNNQHREIALWIIHQAKKDVENCNAGISPTLILIRKYRYTNKKNYLANKYRCQALIRWKHHALKFIETEWFEDLCTMLQLQIEEVREAIRNPTTVKLPGMTNRNFARKSRELI